MLGPNWGIGELWGPRFLMSQSFDRIKRYPTFILVVDGGGVCKPSVRMALRPHRQTSLASLLLFTLAFITSTLLIPTSIILFFAGCDPFCWASAGIQPITFAMVTDQTSRLHIATAIALNNMAIVAVSSFSNP